MTLAQDYRSRMVGCLGRRKANQTLAVTLYVVAFLASFVASIVTVKGAAPYVAAVLAALPGAAAMALATFRPDARAQWWWAKYGKLDDLVQEMEREGKTEGSASKEFREFLRVHEAKYPGFGPVPSGVSELPPNPALQSDERVGRSAPSRVRR